jgi:murein DD-endopeptidase MepM/ murein hydrolase activator NlpD
LFCDIVVDYMPTKKMIFGGVVLGIVLIGTLWGVSFVRNFPERYPEKTLAIERRVSEFFAKLTLPIKIAKLSAQEPDAEVFLPVHGVKRTQISNTWQAPRGDDRVHEGQDIFAARGTPVFSGTSGYVLRIGENELGGNIVYVIGAGGRRYYYAHLDTIAEGLHAGQHVTTDTVVGFVGNTGNAATTPPHLHFGIYENREALNPLPLRTLCCLQNLLHIYTKRAPMGSPMPRFCTRWLTPGGLQPLWEWSLITMQ